jgi:hypothetical protein
VTHPHPVSCAFLAYNSQGAIMVYVLIVGGTIIGVYDDKESLFKEATKYNTFKIKKVKLNGSTG